MLSVCNNSFRAFRLSSRGNVTTKPQYTVMWLHSFNPYPFHLFLVQTICSQIYSGCTCKWRNTILLARRNGRGGRQCGSLLHRRIRSWDSDSVTLLAALGIGLSCFLWDLLLLLAPLLSSFLGLGSLLLKNDGSKTETSRYRVRPMIAIDAIFEVVRQHIHA